MPDPEADPDPPAARVRRALDDFLDRLARIVARDLKPVPRRPRPPGPDAPPAVGPAGGGRS